MLKAMRIGVLAAGLVLVAACAGTSTTDETYDGLVRVPEAKFGEVYRLPDADLSGYEALGLAPCEVAFRKNWLRDQNSASMDLGSRVTQQDVDKIRDALGAECDSYFRQALLEAPAYDLVETFDNGESVLVLRPSIINLDISAPDKMSPGRSSSYTTSAGEMTLLLEAVDGTTGQVLVRVIDRRRGSDTGRLQWTNGVTNRAEADRILRRWAGQLRKGLDATVRP